MKILLIILGVVIGFIGISVLATLGYIWYNYLTIIWDRIDDYFYERQLNKEQEDISKFKKNL